MRNFTLRINLAHGAKKKLFTLFFALVASVGTMFASDTQVDGIWYNFNSTTKVAEVTYRGSNASSYVGEYTGSVTIPSSVVYKNITYTVSNIGEYAFSGCTDLKSVTFLNNGSNIGKSAFSGCTGLTSVAFPNKISDIGESAFSGCTGLTSVTFPENSIYYISIGKNAFYGCTSLTSVDMPNNSVTSIGEYAFCNCVNLPSIKIPEDSDYPIYIHDYAFSSCNELTSVILSEAVKYLGNSVFSYCAKLTSVEIPEKIKITSIGSYTFYNCSSLTSIDIPSSVTSIGDYAFYGCSGLTNIELPNSVTSIGDNAFCKCSGLTSMDIPNSVTSIGSSAFYYCFGLTSVTIGNSVTSIGNSAFFHCSKLSSVTIPNSVTSIGDAAFEGCQGLTSVTIGNSVTSIGNSAFYFCSSLTSVTIPNSVTSIGNDAFSNTGLTSVTLNSNALVNKAYTSSSNFKNIFGGQVTEYFIGDNVSGIGENAFYGCSKLSSVTIGNSVTSIGEDAFYGCTGLKSVHINDLAAWCGITFSGYGSNPLENAHHLFLNNIEIKDLIIPNSVTEIGGWAFSECTGLTSVTIPNSVDSIGDYAFEYCTGLTSIAIGNRVKCIGYGAFEGCQGLTSVHISDLAAWCNITFLSKIDVYYSNPLEYAHHLYLNDTEIKDLIIPNSITSIGNDAFDGCTGLTSVTIPNSVTSIGYWAFFDCIGLSSVTIGKNVTYIGEQAFAYCTGLTSVTCFATTPPDIEYDVFQEIDCSQIPLYVPSESINAYKNAYTWEDFSKIRAIGDAYYIVTFKDWDGTVLKIEEVEQGQSATAPTDPTRENYTFIGWDKEFSNVQSDLIVTAQYTINIHTISATVNDEARGTVTEDQQAEHLTSVELTATANYGYHFEYWESDGKQYTSNPLTVTVTGNALYTAYFFPNTYNINVYSKNSSMGSVSAPQHAEYLDLVTLTANPEEGCHFTQWNDGDTDNPRTIVLTQDTTFVADFAYDRTGTCGKDFALVWSYDPMKKTLTISNAGAFTENMNYGVEAPKEMQELVIDDGVTSIGAGAFKGCSSLQRVTIGNSVTSIGNSAFAGCSNLKSVTLNSNALVSNAYTSSFNLKSIFGEQVTEYIIGEDIISIGNYAFCDCSNLTSVSIGNGVTSIGSSAFYGCKGLTSVHISNLAAWCHTTFSSNVSNPLYYAHHLYLNNTEITELTIPNSVTSIGNYAFNGCTNITSATIPNSVASIGDDAFNGCTGLTSVTVGNNVTSIGNTAFGGCSGLKSITLPHSVTSIGHGAFSDCSGLTSFDIPDGVIGLGQYIFSGCTSLQTISIPKSVNTIIPQYQGYDISPFTGINIDSQSGLPMEGALTAFIVDPENPIYTAKDGVLYNKNMTKLIQFPCAKKDAYTIPESVIYIEDYAFYGNMVLTELNLPRNVRVIETGAFAYMVNLKTLHLPEELVKIGEAGFIGCCNIEELTFGTKLKSIGDQAFTLNLNKCKSITCFAQQVPTLETGYVGAITVGKSTGYIWDNWKDVSPSALTVYVPQESIGDYIMDENWGQFTILPITAQQTNVEDLIVVPSTNTVDCSWPAVSGAVTYELVIKDKSGNLICTLIFNAQGQLTQIAFSAPARDNAPEQTQSAGFHFTVTGLNSGTGYDLSLTAKNESGQEIDKKNVSFHTDAPQAIENLHITSDKSVKILHNGQIYILRREKVYTVQGQEVR